MKTLQKLTCQFCGQPTYSVRNDKIRCTDCRKKYEQEWRSQPEAKERRATAHRKVREKAFAGYGGKCSCCEENTFEFLALDHVNGGGRQERAEGRSTYQIARKVISLSFPPEYRVLCHNCNQAIGWWGSCPHDKLWQRTA